MPVRIVGSASGNSTWRKACGVGQAHAARGIDRGRGHARQSDDGVADDGQQRVQEQGEGRRCGADAAHAHRRECGPGRDERGQRRHQDPEQRDRRNRLHDVQHAEHPGLQPRHAVTEDAERQGDDDGREERAEREQHVLLRLAGEPRRVGRVLAHDRQVVETTGRECGEHAAEEHEQAGDSRQRPESQSRERIGREQAERDREQPERPPGRDAHHAVAGGGQHVGRDADGDQRRGQAGQRDEQADERARCAQRDESGERKHGVEAVGHPRGQHVGDRTRLTGQDAVRLEQDERQQCERETGHDAEHEPERVDSEPACVGPSGHRGAAATRNPDLRR